MKRVHVLLIAAAALALVVGVADSAGQEKKTVEPQPAPRPAPPMPAPGQPANAGGPVAPPARLAQKAAPAQQPADDAMIQQLKQQYGTQIHRLYRGELHFMRVTCNPTKQQYEKIAKDGEAA